MFAGRKFSSEMFLRVNLLISEKCGRGNCKCKQSKLKSSAFKKKEIQEVNVDKKVVPRKEEKRENAIF